MKSDLLSRRLPYDFKMVYQSLGKQEERVLGKNHFDWSCLRVGAYEALLRPKSNTALPEFLSEVDRAGRMPRLTASIVEVVCCDICESRSLYPVHINFYFECLTHAMFEEMFEIMMRYHVPPDMIVVEVLERPFVWNEEALDVMREFRSMGVRLSFDDFAKMPWQYQAIYGFHFDEVKLDISLLNGLNLGDVFEDLESLDVKTIVVEGPTSDLHLRIIEWAEMHLHHPEEMSVYVQGFGFSKPSRRAMMH